MIRTKPGGHGMFLAATMAIAIPAALPAQSFNPGDRPGTQGSSNVHVVSHIPLGRIFTVGNIDIEQEMSRPYVYVSRYTRAADYGFDIITLKDPAKAHVIYQWRIENAALHEGAGCLSGKYFKVRGRYFYLQGCQFGKSGPDADMGAVVVDVTSLPDTSRVKEVGRIRMPETQNGFHETYTYRHSDGRVLFFGTSGAPYVGVYDMDKFLGSPDGPNRGLAVRIPLPENTGTSATRSYHDMYVGYDPATHQDKFYGAGTGGYYIFDITTLEQPKLLTSLTGIAGVTYGHTFTPSPDGRYAVTETEYQYAPLRMFDLKPGLDGTVKTISRPIGAWTPRWSGLPHNHEVRWPYVFVSSDEDGLEIFNWMDPTNPYTVGYYDTYDGPNNRGKNYSTPDPEASWKDPNFPGSVTQGAFGIDVRNADGLIVISDRATGFWAFKMDGFDGWNGHQWGVPNVSSAQDWDNGPDGAPKPQKVS
jgi:hypothetical protein